MVEVVGNEVVQLHRIQFGGNGGGYSGSSVRRHNDDDDSDCISLRNLRGPGDWQELEGRELGLIHQILRQAENVTTAAKTK
jgi:16S rRNA U516 pseudouridylate synthase RsuA-like enzyme